MSAFDQFKSPPHHESVVEVNRDEAEVLGSSMSQHRRKRNAIVIRADWGRGQPGSPIARQLAASPMLFLSRREHPLDVSVQCLHDADARHHRRPAVTFGDQDQDFNRSLPLLDLLFGLR
jgi:hypothetical protein